MSGYLDRLEKSLGKAVDRFLPPADERPKMLSQAEIEEMLIHYKAEKEIRDRKMARGQPDLTIEETNYNEGFRECLETVLGYRK